MYEIMKLEIKRLKEDFANKKEECEALEKEINGLKEEMAENGKLLIKIVICWIIVYSAECVVFN